MQVPSSNDFFLFGGFRLDRRGLFRRDEGAAPVPVEIGSRALDVLSVLLGRPGDLVTRDEIVAAVWPTTVVEDNNLNMQIAALRRILDRDRAQGSCIQTVPGRGYRFLVPVTRVEPATPPVSDGSGRSIAGNGQQLDPDALGRINRMPQITTSRTRHGFRGVVIATLIGALVLVVAVAVGIWHSTWFGGAHPAPRLSIVVLPFANLGNDPEQQYFVDGVTEDLTIDLSRIAHLLVISRNTAFTYRNKQVDTKQIGRELSVRYVLEGTVRRLGNQLRVTAELIDAETDAHLWAERFDRETGDLFALQNEITGRIAVALNLELIDAEAARPTDNPDALDYILRGRAAWNKGPTRDNYSQAISLYERALALDPRSVEAQSWLASALASRLLGQLTDSPTADMARAEGLIGQVLAVSPNSPQAHFAKGQVLRTRGRCEEAIPEFEKVIALDRNSVFAYSHLGWCKLLTGSIDEVIALEEQAIRFSPYDPFISTFYVRIGLAHLLQSHNEEAIVWFEKALSANPGLIDVRAFLASAYALEGDLDRAVSELAEARRGRGDGRYSSIARLKAEGFFGRHGDFGTPKGLALFEATYFVGLRKAGMPEE